MLLFADALDILFRIEFEDNKLRVITKNWLRWYLKIFVIFFGVGGVITALGTFIFSNLIVAYIFMIIGAGPLLYGMFRLQFELKDTQKMQKLFSITFSENGIEIEPTTEKTTITSVLLERPSRSRELFQIPIDTIIDITIRASEDGWGCIYYGLWAECIDSDGNSANILISPLLRKAEQIQSYYGILMTYWNVLHESINRENNSHMAPLLEKTGLALDVNGKLIVSEKE